MNRKSETLVYLACVVFVAMIFVGTAIWCRSVIREADSVCLSAGYEDRVVWDHVDLCVRRDAMGSFITEPLEDVRMRLEAQ